MDRIGRLCTVVLSTFAFLGACAASAAAPVPVDAFAADPVFSRPALSPDGKQVVFVQWIGGKPYIGLLDLTTKASRTLANGSADGFFVRGCDFKTDERLICTFLGVDHDAGRPYNISRMIAINSDGTKVRTLIQNGFAGVSQFQDRILNWLRDDPKKVLVQIDDDGNIFPSVYELDVFSGNLHRVQRDRTPVTGWMTDRSGAVRFGFTYREMTGESEYITRTKSDEPWKVLEKFQRFKDRPFTPLGFGARPNILLVLAPHNGRDAIWEMDLDEGSDYQLLFANSQVDVDGAILWPTDQRVVGFSFHTDRPGAHFIDSTASAVHQSLLKLLPDTWNEVIDGSRDGKRLLIRSYSDVKPPRYYILDLGASKLFLLGMENPALDGVVLAPMKSVDIKAAGDLVIPGYLTIPVGKEAKNLPAIVMPHGGPYARDTWGYDYWVQVLANRGYAVLQMNFRGSTGYGEDWLDAGWHGWGTVMHDDITAGARWLVSEGIADARRMCIVGGSYGGYAALIGIVKEPDLYRCAVSIAGVSDVSRLARDDDRFFGGQRAVQEALGNNRKELIEVSPVKQADRIKVPVLMVHGDDDIQVLVDHSKNMARELKRKGIKNELVLIKDGDHQFSRGEWRLTLLSKMEKFLAENLGTN
jgi:dipeptidyl aminopeptidase/acylaminoacyl peptidase